MFLAVSDHFVLDAPLDDVEAERRREQANIDRALEGDALAFRAIVERHHRGLYALAVRMIGDRTEAEDVVQETFAKAFRRLDSFDPAFRLSTWLYRIALNTCRDHLKSPRRRERPRGLSAVQAHTPADDSMRADALLEQSRRAARVHTAIDRLKPTHREVLVLKDLQELSYEEIHRITGAPVTALKIRAVRARAKLRLLLEEDGT